jgi:hypothetical protein
MKRIHWLCLFVLPLTSCSSSTPSSTAPSAPSKPQAAANSPQQLIIAKWQRTDPGKEQGTLEFLQGGKMKIDGVDGTYKFLDDGTLEYEYSPAFEVLYSKCKITVTPTELICQVVEAKSKPSANEAWTVTKADNDRKVTEKYKKAQ